MPVLSMFGPACLKSVMAGTRKTTEEKIYEKDGS